MSGAPGIPAADGHGEGDAAGEVAAPTLLSGMSDAVNAATNIAPTNDVRIFTADTPTGEGLGQTMIRALPKNSCVDSVMGPLAQTHHGTILDVSLPYRVGR